MMLGSLKESTEQRALVDEATKYLRGIRGDLVRRKKAQAMKHSSSVHATPIRGGRDLSSSTWPRSADRNLPQRSSDNPSNISQLPWSIPSQMLPWMANAAHSNLGLPER